MSTVTERVEIPLRNPETLAGLALADERISQANVDALLERLLLASIDERPHVLRRHGVAESER